MNFVTGLFISQWEETICFRLARSLLGRNHRFERARLNRFRREIGTTLQLTGDELSRGSHQQTPTPSSTCYLDRRAFARSKKIMLSDRHRLCLAGLGTCGNEPSSTPSSIERDATGPNAFRSLLPFGIPRANGLLRRRFQTAEIRDSCETDQRGGSSSVDGAGYGPNSRLQ